MFGALSSEHRADRPQDEHGHRCGRQQGVERHGPAEKARAARREAAHRLADNRIGLGQHRGPEAILRRDRHGRPARSLRRALIALEMIPFRGKRDWASKAIVDLDGNPVTEAKLNDIGIEHSKPLRFQRAEIAILMPQGGAAANATQIDGEEFEAASRATIEVIPRALRLIIP